MLKRSQLQFCKPFPARLFAGILMLAASSYAAPFRAAEIRVDAGRQIGAIRAIHGINGGPICQGGMVDLSPYHKTLGIPVTRIHDANWPCRDVVNIHAVFPNFSADADSPGSYQFGPTDDYLKSILAVGSEVLYRLGENIEHTPRKLYVHKPADYDQWTKICLGIIRHYNEGWADGFHFNLRCFEIWNEVEIGDKMWDGNSEDYYRLYATAATAIKTRWPKLLVGGPAAVDLGQLDGDQLTPKPHLRGFLEYCRKHSLPLDFLSWHSYAADPSSPVRSAIGLRRVLDAYGFQKTESYLDEWNYLPGGDWAPVFSHDGARMQKSFEEAGGPKGAAFVAYVLLGLQDAPLDMSNFYAADNGYWSLFNFFGAPKKTYYAFKAFKALVDHPKRVFVEGGKAGALNSVAGLSADGRELAIVVSNFNSADAEIKLVLTNLPWTGPSAIQLLVLDQSRNLERIRKEERRNHTIKIVQALPAPGVLLVYVRPQ